MVNCLIVCFAETVRCLFVNTSFDGTFCNKFAAEVKIITNSLGLREASLDKIFARSERICLFGETLSYGTVSHLGKKYVLEWGLKNLESL